MIEMTWKNILKRYVSDIDQYLYPDAPNPTAAHYAEQDKLDEEYFKELNTPQQQPLQQAKQPQQPPPPTSPPTSPPQPPTLPPPPTSPPSPLQQQQATKQAYEQARQQRDTGRTKMMSNLRNQALADPKLQKEIAAMKQKHAEKMKTLQQKAQKLADSQRAEIERLNQEYQTKLQGRSIQ